MSEVQIIRRASTRMWRVHVPLIAILLGCSGLTSSLDNGVAALLALVAGAFVLVALLDWFGAELAAGRAN